MKSPSKFKLQHHFSIVGRYSKLDICISTAIPTSNFDLRPPKITHILKTASATNFKMKFGCSTFHDLNIHAWI